MSDSKAGEIAELKAHARELQRSLDTITQRLDALADQKRREEPTLCTRRPAAWWQRPALVAIASSGATAFTIGTVIAVVSAFGEAPPPAPSPLPPPVAVAPPPPPLTPPPPPAEHVAPSGTALTVICLPAKCTEIVDNGVSLGRGHIFARPVEAGRHRLVLRGANGALKSVTVDVAPDQLKDVRLAFTDDEGRAQTPPDPPPSRGNLTDDRL